MIYDTLHNALILASLWQYVVYNKNEVGTLFSWTLLKCSRTHSLRNKSKLNGYGNEAMVVYRKEHWISDNCVFPLSRNMILDLAVKFLGSQFPHL